MPLEKGSSNETISKNIQLLMREGYPKNQATAIAFTVAGRGESLGRNKQLGEFLTKVRSGKGVELRVPQYAQVTNYTCGPAALKAVLAAFGIHAREDDLAAIAGTTAAGGTSAQGLAIAAREFGTQASVEIGLSTVDLKENLIRGRLIIACIQAWAASAEGNYDDFWENSHWVVPYAMKNSNVEVMDPAIEDIMATLTEEEFDERWHGINYGDKFYGLGLIVTGKTPANIGLALPKMPMG